MKTPLPHLTKFFLMLLILMACSDLHPQGLNIEWDNTTCKFITTGGYARVKKLVSGELALVYSDQSDVWIRKSSNEGITWGNAVNVAHTQGVNNTNSELIQLTNGWLLYGWNGRPSKQNPQLHYTICTSISKDNGETWGNEVIAYSGDTTWANGVWEPSFLQVPSGEVQLYFANESPFTQNNDQEITMMRSSDNGLTWKNAKQIAYRTGSRDGMPVPIYLKNNMGIAMSIEDPGLNGTFKPVIIWTSLADNWNQPAANGNSPHRWGALTLPSVVYAGAPYLVQLPTGETLLSVQSTEGRISNADNVSIMQVYVGDATAKNFKNKSTPFLNIAKNGNAMWNSLTVINKNTVMAVSSVQTAGHGPNGIWIVMGKVIR